jgi:F-type H+-transporting ATPase subunit epsilon
MAALLKVKIITPKRVVFDGTALAVTLPAQAGEMQVYQGHIPVLTRVAAGAVRLENPGEAPQLFQVDEGFARVTQDEVSLLIDNVETA